jgi:hypothetical protein
MCFFWRLLFLSLWFITYCRYCHLGEIIVANLDEMTYQDYEIDIVEKTKNIAMNYSINLPQEFNIYRPQQSLVQLIFHSDITEKDKKFVEFVYGLQTIAHIHITFCKYDLDFLNPAAHTIEKLVGDPAVPLTDCSVFLTVLQNYAAIMEIARDVNHEVEQLYPIPQYKVLGIPFRHVFVEDAHRFLTGRRFKFGESYEVPSSIIAQELGTFYSKEAQHITKGLFSRYKSING